MSYPQSTEDINVSKQFALIELAAYAHHRKTMSAANMQTIGYPRADELEKIYKDMVK